MKLLIITAIYKRHDLTRIVLNYYKSLQNKYNLQLLAVGSEMELSRNLCKECGWDYMAYSNKYLSLKMNAITQQCETYDYDAILLVGSDDLVSEEIIQYYIDNYNRNTPYMVGFKGCYMYNVADSRLIHFKGYTCEIKRTIGAGRLFSRSVMDRIKHKPWGKAKIRRALDYTCSTVLERHGIGEEMISFEDTGGMIVDIKHRVNITPFENLLVNCEEINPELLNRYFPEQIKQINSLKI